MNSGVEVPVPVLSKKLAAKMEAAGGAIPVLLGFTEDESSERLQELRPTCPPGKDWDDRECQASAKRAEKAAARLTAKRLNKVQNFLLKLGAIFRRDQVESALAIGNIFYALMTPVQVNRTMSLVMNATVRVTDSDYLQLRVIEDPLEPLVAQQGASGSCTNRDAFTFTDPALARMATTADVFYDSTLGSNARIAVIDQGINSGHTLLAGRLGYVGDCSTTSSSCVGSVCGGNCCRRMAGTLARVDQCASYGSLGSGSGAAHGTACASLVSGNSNCLGAYRGASNYVVDFFRAFFTIDFINAFQAAVVSGDSIVSTSLGVNSAQEALSSVSLAADSAYDAGLIIFSAAGNFGCSTQFNGGCSTNWGFTSSGTCTAPISGSVMAPANAHKVIAVGAYSAAVHSVSSGSSHGPSSTALRNVAPMCYSARGPARNGRIKPDIMGPTGVEAAFTATSSTALAYFSGTSAATPNVAGAFATFMAFRRANRGASGTVPTRGEFMASIIAAGENFGLPNNNVGAGAYRPGALSANTLGTGALNTWATFGFSSLTQTANISIAVATTARPVKCAIWWPQSATAARLSNFDLALIAPDGVTTATSALAASVWEKVSVATPVVGTYTLRITVNALAGLTQQVHAFCFF